MQMLVQFLVLNLRVPETWLKNQTCSFKCHFNHGDHQLVHLLWSWWKEKSIINHLVYLNLLNNSKIKITVVNRIKWYHCQIFLISLLRLFVILLLVLLFSLLKLIYLWLLTLNQLIRIRIRILQLKLIIKIQIKIIFLIIYSFGQVKDLKNHQNIRSNRNK